MWIVAVMVFVMPDLIAMGYAAVLGVIQGWFGLSTAMPCFYLFAFCVSMGTLFFQRQLARNR